MACLKPSAFVAKISHLASAQTAIFSCETGLHESCRHLLDNIYDIANVAAALHAA